MSIRCWKEKYPLISNKIEEEWDENIVNIEYLTKNVVEWIQDHIEIYSLEALADINISGDKSVVNAILLSLEPDCINGTSLSGHSVFCNKEQLTSLNKALIKAYIDDTTNMRDINL